MNRSLPARLRTLHPADWLALLGFVLLAVFYFRRLEAWLIGDDEGSYLYAAWRIALGELPYRDFLTPQLPAFLIPGGLLMKWLGPNVWAARALATALTLLAGVNVWATARRLFGPAVGLLAGAILLLQPDVYLFCRTFRADPFMLFFATLGVYLFVRAQWPSQDSTHALLSIEIETRPTVGTGSLSPGETESLRPGDTELLRSGKIESLTPRETGIARGAPAPTQSKTSAWLLTLSGIAFGLATLSKLFGPLPLAACLAWLGGEAVLLRRRTLRSAVRDGLIPLIACGATVAVVMGGFLLISSEVIEATVGHHLRQGAGIGMVQAFKNGLAFYTLYLRQNSNALLAFVAVAAGVLAWRQRDRAASLFAWQLPTALIFLVLTRDAYERHLIYLVPAMGTLWAMWMCRLMHTGQMRPGETGSGHNGTVQTGTAQIGASQTGTGQRWLAGALILALLLPWRWLDVDHGWRWEVGTARMGDFIQLVSKPDELVFSDYSELNFYGRRPTTYSAASLSSGAARSGQITWQRMERELAGRLPRLLVIDTDAVYAHLHFLTDRPAYDAWLAKFYGDPVGTFVRDVQRYRIHVPKDRPLPVLARFDGGPALLASEVMSGEAGVGDAIPIRSAWQATDRIGAELYMTARLVDADGTEWAQSDGVLTASDGSSPLHVRSTLAWEPGEMTADRVELTVPPGTPPGDYDVLLGLYRKPDLARLGISDGDGTVVNQSVVVGKVRVRPWQASEAEIRALPIQHRVNEVLLGYASLPTETIQAGTVFPLELWWRSNVGEDPEGEYGIVAVRLTLSNTQGATASDQTADLGVPGTSAFSWQMGTVAKQIVRVPVSAVAPSGSYSLTVYAKPSLLRYMEGVVIGTVRVAARDLSGVVTTVPPVGRPISATLGSVGELVGVDLQPSVSAGQPLTVTLVWRALSSTEIDYKVTVQMLDAYGHPLAQHDSEPAEWKRPTSGWIPGEVILDAHVLTLPQSVAPGRYHVVAAMYHPGTGRRLAASGHEFPRDLVQLGELEVVVGAR